MESSMSQIRCAGCLLIYPLSECEEQPDGIMYCSKKCYETQGGTL